MAYEKYIKKDGKLYGPYIYHSRRVDGKVVSEYHGQKPGYGKFLWIVLFSFLIIFGAYFIGQRQSAATGYSVLDLNANYNEGQALSGEARLSLQQGELLPASSTVVFENAGSSYEYPLKELILESAAEGNFFIKDKSLSGSGEGFGIPGTREIYPEVHFVLSIEKPDLNDSTIVSVTEIEGSVSADNVFIYELQEGERAEIKPRSVKVSNADGTTTQLNDDDISIITDGSIVSISTTYSEEEEGFGSDFIGNEIKELTINLGSLEILPEKGDLKVGIFYGGEEIISLATTIGGNETKEEIEASTPEVQIEQTPEQETTPPMTEEITPPEPNASEIIEEKNFSITFPELELTVEERTALENEFGNISLEVIETKLKNGFIIVRYEMREDTWVNYSYSADLDNETLQFFMEQDKMKWFKDLAKKYSV